MSESTDSNIKRITNALLQTAGKLTNLKQDIKDGNRFNGLDITSDITIAAEKFAFLRSEGVPIDIFLQQQNLFGDEFSPMQRRLLTFFDKYKNSAKAMSSIIDRYVVLSNEFGDPNQGNLFGKQEANAEELFKSAVIHYEENNPRQNTQQTSLFDENQGRENQPQDSGSRDRVSAEELQGKADTERGRTTQEVETENELMRSVASLEEGEFNTQDFQKERDSIPLEQNDKGELLAPNGAVSKIQNKELWRTVRTKAFKDWFGDWEAQAVDVDQKRRIESLLPGSSRTDRNAQKTVLSTVSENEKIRILKDAGIELQGDLRHIIDKSAINHVKNQHPDISDADFLLIPQILRAPDVIENGGKTRQGLDTIRYSKRFNGHIVYLEEIRNKRHDLALKTLYKKNKGDSLNNPRVSTSKTTLVYENDNIPSSPEQEVSKVVDENGEPLVVYHGMDKNFDVFEKDRSFDGNFWFTSDVKGINKGELLAPNGAVSKIQKPELWRTVRTKAFKDWFGDWLGKIRYQKVANSKPIKIRTRKGSFIQAKKQYKALTESINKVDGRKIEFVNSVSGKILGHKGSELIRRLIPQLPEVVENAQPIYFEAERDARKHRNIKGFHNYLAKVKIDQQDYYVRITAQELKPGSKESAKNELHSTFISDVQVYEANEAIVHSGIIEPAKSYLTSVSFDKILSKFINGTQNISKVVDENGEPLVVYHGTDKNFEVFENDRSYDGNFWFTSDVKVINEGEVGAGGKGVVVPVFLNIKKAAGWNKYESLVQTQIENKGFDEIQLDEDFVVFKPNQIKSIRNQGSFNANDPSIMRSSADPLPPTRIRDIPQCLRQLQHRHLMLNHFLLSFHFFPPIYYTIVLEET